MEKSGAKMILMIRFEKVLRMKAHAPIFRCQELCRLMPHFLWITSKQSANNGLHRIVESVKQFLAFGAAYAKKLLQQGRCKPPIDVTASHKRLNRLLQVVAVHRIPGEIF